jgi:hypothetical protein
MKTILTYGFCLALANFLLTLVLFILGFHSDAGKMAAAQWIGGGVSLAISVTVIALGTRARRDSLAPDAAFSYGSAVGAGFLISIVSTVLSTAGNYVYVTFINPHFVDVVVQSQLDKLSAKGLSSDQLDQAERLIRMTMGPLWQGVIFIIMGLLFGIVISLVTAAFLKRPAPSQGAPA